MFCYTQIVAASIHKNTRLLTWFNLFEDFRPYHPIEVLYFFQVTGSFALSLLILSIYTLSSSIFEVPTGVLSDMIGRRKTIILGSLSATIGLILYAIGGSFWILAAGAVVGGLARSFFSGNNEALLHDSLAQEGKEGEYAEFLGRTSSMFQIGLAMSALLGGFIANVSFGWVLWLSVIPQFTCFLLSFRFIEPKVHVEKTTNVFHHLKGALKRFKENYKLRTLSLASIIDYGIGQTMHPFSSVFVATLWPIWGVGIYSFLNHFFAFISFWFAGRVIKKFNALKTLLGGKALSNVLNLIAYGYPTILSPIIVPITSLFFGFKTTAENSLMQKEFTNEQRATMGSINAFGGNLFFAIFAFAFGLAADRLGPARSLLVGEILLVPLLILYWKLFSHDRKIRSV